jgi:hypothetical protein
MLVMKLRMLPVLNKLDQDPRDDSGDGKDFIVPEVDEG